MTTRITIRTPDEVGEAARALQEVNRQRLEDRQRDAWAWRDTLREIRDRRAKVNSQASKANPRDPWRGAVPEFEEPGFTPVQVRGKRFRVAGGYLQRIGDRLEASTADGAIRKSIELFGIPTGQVSLGDAAFPWGILLPGGGNRLVFVYSQVWAWQSEYYSAHYFDSHKSIVVTHDAIKVVDTPAKLREIGFRYNGKPIIREDNGQLDDDIDHAPYMLDGSSYLYLLRSYGYGKLLTLEEYPSFPGVVAQSPNWGTTPAIFSFLKNYDGEFHLGSPPPGTKQNAESYEYISSKYFLQDAPDYMLTSGWQLQGAEVDTTNRLYYFKTPGLQGASIRSLDSFTIGENGIRIKPNRGRNSAVPVFSNSALWASIGQEFLSGFAFEGLNASTADPYPIATWDWNRPLACIYELLDLGFTAEDLMLTEAETAAMAAADPAVVRFKF